MRNLWSKIVADIDIAQAMEHAKWLCDTIPERKAGTEEERRAVEYFKDALNSYGVKTTIDEFDAHVSVPIDSSLVVISPERKDIKTQTYGQIAPTPPEGIEAEIFYMERGTEDDFEGVEVRGKIMLTSLGSPPWRPEKARIAMKKGVAGQIQINTGPRSSQLLPYGTVKAVWGNPVPSNYEDMPTIPVVGISAADGNALIEMCKKGPVKVRLKARAENGWRPVRQVMGWLQGQSDEFMLVGGHFDCWGGGATCNAVGNSALLEIARAMAKNQAQLPKSIMFTMFTGHETGMSAGSAHFIDRNWDNLNRNAVAYTILDSVGIGGTTTLISRNTPEIVRFLKIVESDLLDRAIVHTPAQRVGDHSFYGMGLPTIFATTATKEAADRAASEMGESWGLSLGWFYHSDLDTFDRIGADVLLEDMRTQAAYISGFISAPVPPYEFVSSCDIMRDRLKQVDAISRDFLPLGDVIKAVEALRVKAVQLDEAVAKANSGKSDRERVAALSALQRRVCKTIMPVMKTLGGRYNQDSYGLMATEKYLPGLEALVAVAKAPKGSVRQRLNLTQAPRERNRIKDAVEEATLCISKALKE